jgi:CRP-like cAMP-binding protein
MNIESYPGTTALWLGGIAFALLAASYLVAATAQMRLLAAAAFLAGAIGVSAAGGSLHWPLLAILLGLASINAIQYLRHRRIATGNALSVQEQALRAWLFPTLGDADFQQLLKVSQRSFPTAGTFLVTQGEHLDHLYIIIQGTAHVVANGMVVASLHDGNLVGEVSFFRDDVATASVVAQTELSVLAIERGQLRKLMRESEALQRALHESIGRDLGFKLTSFDASSL